MLQPSDLGDALSVRRCAGAAVEVSGTTTTTHTIPHPRAHAIVTGVTCTSGIGHSLTALVGRGLHSVVKWEPPCAEPMCRLAMRRGA